MIRRWVYLWFCPLRLIDHKNMFFHMAGSFNYWKKNKYVVRYLFPFGKRYFKIVKQLEKIEKD
jgi:hypothetical protein